MSSRRWVLPPPVRLRRTSRPEGWLGCLSSPPPLGCWLGGVPALVRTASVLKNDGKMGEISIICKYYRL